MRLRRLGSPLAAVIALLAFNAAASASILISIDKSAQRMTVTVDGDPRYSWPVSTGKADYDTPAGEFQPFRMERHHFSREWDDAPMPHSIFFTQIGHAIHGSYDVKHLGRPASHGCVRLSPQNAATLFALVKEQGVKNTHVTLSGELPAGANELVARREQAVDPNDDDVTATLPPAGQRSARGWRDYPEGQRYYYRERPRYYVRRYFYAPRYYVRRYYGYAPFRW